jgi:H+-transporting ATPase
VLRLDDNVAIATDTSRVLIFIAPAILALKSHPVTPIMIISLATLNDVPIMTVAAGNTLTAAHPVRSQLGRFLTVARFLAIGGVIAAFGLYWFARTYTGLQARPCKR